MPGIQKQQPCQNCGRCTQGGDRGSWAPLGAVAATGARAGGPAAVAAGDIADVAGYVRALVREFAGVVPDGGARGVASQPDFALPVGISVRHLHICPADLLTLYGPGARLTKKSELYEPGEFASEQVVTLVGPRLRTIENVRILGPARDFTQVELSRTDAFALGLDLPMRRSGDLRGAAPLTIVGPAGSLTMSNVAIRSNRHIHMGPEDAARFGVGDNEIVRVRVPGDEGVIYENVQVRVHEGWLLTLHVDTDDANASNLFCNMQAYLLPNR